ncbi:MAG TPA: hypothetical protein PKI46_05185 [Bacteroidales bacterium]|nr:hypothetical protein [Bacteroidales bacterium]
MIEEIENITIKEFFSLEENKLLELYRILRLIKSDGRHIQSIQLLSYKDVVQLKQLCTIQTPINIIAIIEGVFEIPLKQQREMKLTEYFPLLNFVINGIEEIIEMEHIRLSSTAKDDLIMAGVELLNQYGDIATIDALAGGDILRWQQIELLPWQIVFTKLCMDKDKAQIQENYLEIIKNKNTTNAHS